MKRIKIMTIVGTRPEIIRLSSVIEKMENSNAVEHILVHTGQNYDYELNQIFFDDFKLRKPDYFLNTATGSPIGTIGNILIAIEPILESNRPDAILVLGDTNSCLCSIAAKRMQIPIFHMEAGNRCFDLRVPEEINRRIVDHISDINLTYSDIAREYLLREGISPDRIIKTGSPMQEVLLSRRGDIERSNILSKLNLISGEYFLVSMHRDENINSSSKFTELCEALNKVSIKFNLPIIVSTHPRTQKMIDKLNIKFEDNIVILKPLGFNDYIKLQTNSKAVLSDSGTISEESSILGFKALNLRDTHERPEAMEEASVMMVGSNADRILQGLSILETQATSTLNQVRDYSYSNVSDKVLRIIVSYVDYVNRVVWSK